MKHDDHDRHSVAARLSHGYQNFDGSIDFPSTLDGPLSIKHMIIGLVPKLLWPGPQESPYLVSHHHWEIKHLGIKRSPGLLPMYILPLLE